MPEEYDGATPADTQTTQVPKKDAFSELLADSLRRTYKDGYEAGYANGHKIGRMDGHNAAAQHCIDAQHVEAAALLVAKFDEIQ